MSECGLSPHRIRGQAYDGASNIRGAFNGLKTLIMKEVQSTHYIHCFAQQLQLALVFVVKNHADINDFFDLISRLLNVIESSYKRLDKLRETQTTKLVEALATVSNVDVFVAVIDMQSQELNNRFKEVNTSLLVSMASLCSRKYFKAFNVEELLKMAKFYPSEFSEHELGALKANLQNYIIDVHGDPRFNKLKGIGNLAKMMIETNKHTIYPMKYLLLKLTLILPVATSTIEPTFSTMKLIKNDLRNKMSDQFMNDCLVSYGEKDVLDSINNNAIIDYFRNMKPRRE
ncbi:uncharacterized protein LOC111879783 [Lactuca sativa]|uniref:uncharacterized protein LOC111879783 n=1 Tax=Lactuca sativa TaxID=4236 RepID=UPI000CD8955F|nr:uncharacterized protein LOC111879783 [Lactuca sativa]